MLVSLFFKEDSIDNSMYFTAIFRERGAGSVKPLLCRGFLSIPLWSLERRTTKLGALRIQRVLATVLSIGPLEYLKVA